MSNISDINRDAFMLKDALAECGYDWWWHSFTGYDTMTGEAKGFFIEFFTVNPASGGDEPILGQLEYNRKNDIRPSYVMIKVGAWGENAMQLHRFFGWNQVSVSSDVPFHIEAADCELSETHTKGSVCVDVRDAEEHSEWMSDSGSMSWDLSINKKIAFNVGYGASRPMRDSGAFEMFWHAEGMKTGYSGEIVCNGRSFRVSEEDCYGYADKNWGKDFTSPWVWLSSNNLISRKTGKKLENSVFNIGGGRPKVGHLALNRKLLSNFHYEGTDYEFNFSKFWTLTKTQFDCIETDDSIEWEVSQETPLHRMVTRVSCDKKDMLLINYEAPDGSKRHNRLWNGGNGRGTVMLYKKQISGDELIDEVEAYNIGCEYGEYDR